MLRVMRTLYLSAILVFWTGGSSALGFSLLGPFAQWQTDQLSYRLFAAVGGPMNLGEEYRWNTPNIFYGFDESFLNYFGQRGVAEIEKAVKILNDLPPISQIRLEDYPTHSQRINFRAQAVQMFDLKSMALGVLVEQLGLADPTRFVFTLRTRWTPASGTNYFVIQRNFDPVTFEPTTFINGQLWTYSTITEIDLGGLRAFPNSQPVDPLIFAEPVATRLGFTFQRFGTGSYYTGLTRDDIGGLRYLYRPENRNVEDAPPNTTSGGIFGLGSPWGPVLFTNLFTNIVATNVTIGLRPGLDKITFRRVDFDSLVGQTFVSITNTYSDTMITNKLPIRSNVQRIITQPDILFSAADLTGDVPGGGSDTANTTPVLLRDDTTRWVNNNNLNGLETLHGPGTITPPVRITFNKVGHIALNAQPSFLFESSPIFRWGSFDGSTNAPFLYPSGSSIDELERQILGRR